MLNEPGYSLLQEKKGRIERFEVVRGALTTGGSSRCSRRPYGDGGDG